MRCKSIRIAAVLGAWSCLVFTPAARGQTAVVAVKSLDGLLADARSLKPLLGKGQLAGALDAGLQAVAALRDQLGLDGSRPLGMYLNWPAGWARKGFRPWPGIGFVPIRDEKKLLALLQQTERPVKAARDGIHQVALPGGGTGYVRLAHRHAFVALDRAVLRGDLPQPAKLLPPMPPERLLIFRWRPDRVPAPDRRYLLDSFDTFNSHFFGPPTKQKGEHPVMANVRLVYRSFLTGLVSLFREGQEVSLRLDLDHKQYQLTLDLTVVPRPRSTLAASLKYLATGRTLFTGLHPKAKLSVFFHQPRSRPRGGTGMNIFEGIESFQDNPVPVPVLHRAGEVLSLIVSAKAYDYGLAFQVCERGWTWIVGARIQNGHKLENLIRQLVKDLPAGEKEFLGMNWNYARHGTTRIHRVGAIIGFQSRFGNKWPDGQRGNLYFAIRDQVALGSVGIGGADSGAAKDTGSPGLSAIRGALEGLDNPGGRAPPIFRLEACPAWVILMAHVLTADQKDPAVRTALQEIIGSAKAPDAQALDRLGSPFLTKLLQGFPAEDWDRAKVRFVLEGGQALHLRLEVHTHLLRMAAPLQEITVGVFSPRRR
jgi:hypothetical protein